MILGQNGHISPYLIWEKRIPKKDFALFTIIVPGPHAKFKKILGAVSDINCVTYVRTHILTDGQGVQAVSPGHYDD